jgi:hypothetical protein
MHVFQPSPDMCEPLNMGEALCMSNIDEVEAKNVANMVDKVFLKQSSPLLDVETPIFLSFKIPMLEQCNTIFGPMDPLQSAPLTYQELAFSESKENNAVEFIFKLDVILI